MSSKLSLQSMLQVDKSDQIKCRETYVVLMVCADVRSHMLINVRKYKPNKRCKFLTIYTVWGEKEEKRF